MEFGYLRTNLELSAGNLSQHLGAPKTPGSSPSKRATRKRARTWVTITKAGRAALAEEITQLKLLISRIDSPDRHRAAWLGSRVQRGKRPAG